MCTLCEFKFFDINQLCLAQSTDILFQKKKKNEKKTEKRRRKEKNIEWAMQKMKTNWKLCVRLLRQLLMLGAIVDGRQLKLMTNSFFFFLLIFFSFHSPLVTPSKRNNHIVRQWIESPTFFSFFFFLHSKTKKYFYFSAIKYKWWLLSRIERVPCIRLPSSQLGKCSTNFQLKMQE